MCVVVYCRGRRISDWSEITGFFWVGLCFSRPWVNRRLFSLAQTHSAYSLPTAAPLTPVCDRLYHIYILSIRRLSKQSYCSSCPSPRSAASVHFITAPSEVCGFFLFFASFLTLQLAEQFLFPYFLFFIFWTENITWWEWIQFSHTS